MLSSTFSEILPRPTRICYLGSPESFFTRCFLPKLRELHIDQLKCILILQSEPTCSPSRADIILRLMLRLRKVKNRILLWSSGIYWSYYCQVNNIDIHLTNQLENPISKSMLSESDLVITAGLRQKIPATIFSLPKYGMVNFHYSILPKYRGSLPVFWQKLASDLAYGYTFHRITDQLDSGEIILQKQVEISPTLKDSEICDQLTSHASQQFPWVLNQLHAGHKQPKSIRPPYRFQEYCNYIRISFSQPPMIWNTKSKQTNSFILEDRWWVHMELKEICPSSQHSLTLNGASLVLQREHYRWVIRKINYLPAILFYFQLRKFV